MKSLKNYLSNIQEAKNFEMPNVKLNKLTVSDLDKYITKCDKKFLSDETLYILKYMKDNFTEGKEITNLDFINNGWNNGELDSKIKDKVIALNKVKRIKELPMFLTDDEFKQVINGERPLDFFVYDFTSEQGRNELVKRFEPMLKNAAFKASKKVGYDYDEMYSAGLEGFTYAMNNYGKLRSEYVRTSNNKFDVEAQIEKEKKLGLTPQNSTFSSFATAHVSNAINEYIQNEMSIIRRPKSNQRAEKKETGSVSKERKLSGDAAVGNDKDGNSRNMWDKLGDDIGVEQGGQSIDDAEVEELWKQVYKRIETRFAKDLDVVELWYVRNGLNGREQKNIKGEGKYYKLGLIEKYLVTDPVCKKLLNEIYEISADYSC